MVDVLSNWYQASPFTGWLMLSCVLIYFVGGVVKGTLGIGFPTTAISLLAQITDARTAISLVVVPMVVTNAWQMWRSGQIVWVVSRFWPLLVLSVALIGVFSQFASAVPVAALTAVLGAIVVIYAGSSLYKPVFSIPTQYDTLAQVIAGVISGAMGGIAGVWAPPIIIYLGSLKLTKEQFVATTGLLLFLGSSVLLLGYVNAGLLGSSLFFFSCALLLPTMAGVVVGEQIRKRLSAQHFERALLWLFLVMGLNLIRRALL